MWAVGEQRPQVGGGGDGVGERRRVRGADLGVGGEAEFVEADAPLQAAGEHVGDDGLDGGIGAAAA